MKTFLVAALIALGVGLIGAPNASAAPASPAAIADAAAAGNAVQQVWWDRYGRWHPNRRIYRGPAFIAPRCAPVRVCNRWGRCWVRTRCF